MMKFTRSTVFAAVLSAAAPATALAHSGNHAFGATDTLVHMLSSADHLLLVSGAVFCGAILAVAVRWVWRSR